MSLKSIARCLALLSAVSVTSGLLSAPAPAETETSRKTVNINQATADELARLPRVGSKLAGRIVTHRSQHGPFKRAEDLMAVKGVGEKKFASLKPYLAVSGSTTLTEKVSSAKGSRPAARPRAPGKAPKKASDTASAAK
jgi:competence protein ComEA